MGLMMFLFWGINFSKISEADIDFDWLEVIRIIDGDTIEVEIDDEVKSIRLIGIDAPEIEGKSKEKGIISKNFLKNLIGNETVRLESDETQDDKDIYNRLLRYVFLKDGRMINGEMIKSKMAKEYTFIVPYKYQEIFRDLESK